MHQFGASHVGAQLPFAELRRLNVELRDLVETMIGAQPADHPTRTQVDQAVLDHAAREADRARAWFAGTRIDIHWNTLPTIEEALGKARQR